MKILFMLPSWPFYYGSYIYREMAWLLDRGHELSVVSLKQDSHLGHSIVHDFGLDQTPVLQIDAENLDVKALKAFLFEQKIEVAHVHMAREAAKLASLIKKETGIPFSVKLHGGDVHSNPSPFLQEIIDNAGAICPVSRYLGELLTGKRRLENNPSILPVLIPPEKFRICANGLPLNNMALKPVPQPVYGHTIICVGRLVTNKGCTNVIHAVASLAKRYDNLQLRIIGDGIERDSLLGLVRLLACEDRIHFAGALPWSEVMEEMARAQIYVSASLLEGFSMTTLEAASVGLPLLVSRTGISEELVDNGVNGFLFDANDQKDLTSKMEEMLRCTPAKRYRMASLALKRARKNFSFEPLMVDYESILIAVRDGLTIGGQSPECIP